MTLKDWLELGGYAVTTFGALCAFLSAILTTKISATVNELKVWCAERFVTFQDLDRAQGLKVERNDNVWNIR